MRLVKNSKIIQLKILSESKTQENKRYVTQGSSNYHLNHVLILNIKYQMRLYDNL